MNRLSGFAKKSKGALTVEAAIVMPLFICVVLSFALFIKIVYTQNIIQHAINETANELAVYSYLYSVSGLQKLHDDAKDKLEENSKPAEEQINSIVDALNTLNNTKKAVKQGSENLKNKDFEELKSDLEDIKDLSKEALSKGKDVKEKLESALKNPKEQVIAYASLLANGAFEDLKGELAAPVVRLMCKKHIGSDEIDADKRLKSLGVVNGLSGLDFSETKILNDKKNIDIIVRYKVESGLPINFLPDLYFIQRAKVRAWLNGDGKTPNSVDSEPASEPASENFWELDPLERAKRIHELENADMPVNYNEGDIIDVTTINLSDKSYATTNGVKYRIYLSIRKLAEFTHKDYPDIKSRTLIVIIPEKSLEARPDVEKLLKEDCMEYAKKHNVILKYKEGYGVLPQSRVE
ncbi:TadE/TadG family type IV pilus assembly protein [Acetivibrio clariflavus]|uniref:TadE-like protein n=1 Tax=Acetivibrio clariflavus (strain DSM 19732 / NBRC 101661 / EBR45) TaxID=720554 RepID=G8LTB3_ACECE|nr:TadE/TadG family type IV pilus assembly protein [Acetivibrio clariflavus]AEV68360.1 TadE-like protein [Acetivibrio clariflavus DSM 19732]